MQDTPMFLGGIIGTIIINVVNVMNHDKTVVLIDDRISQRFESWVQTQQKLHQDFHDKMITAVEQKMDAKFNGKVDNIKKQLDNQDTILKSLDNRIKPFEDGVSWFTRARNGTGWVAGFLGAIALIWASLIWIIDHLK